MRVGKFVVLVPEMAAKTHLTLKGMGKTCKVLAEITTQKVLERSKALDTVLLILIVYFCHDQNYFIKG